MFRKVFNLAAIVLVFWACEVQAEVIHSTWVGGESDYWSHPANWDPAIVPDNSASQKFLVTIDSNSIGMEKIEINLSFAERVDVNQVDCYGTVELEGSSIITLVDTNGFTNHGILKIRGEMDIEGNVLNTNGALLQGWFNVEGADLVNQAGGKISCFDHYIDVDDGNIWNYGTILSGPPGGAWADYQFHNFGCVETYGGMCSSDQAFTNESTGVIKGFGVVHSDQVIINRGLIQSFAGDLVLHSRVDFEGSYIPNWGITNTGTLANTPGTSLTVMVWVPDVNNQGTIEVNTDGSVVFDCNLVNEPNAVIRLLGGSLAVQTIKQSAGATFEGFGGITGNLVIEANGVVDVNGPTNIVGDVKIEPNATLEIRDGTTLIRGHTTCNNGTIHMIGGRVICQGGLTNNNCNVDWDPGLYTNMADFNLDGKVSFEDFAYFADVWLWKTQL